MKHTLTLALLPLTATGCGQTNVTVNLTNEPIIEVLAETVKNSKVDITGKCIRKLAASGEICKVFGHWWGEDWTGNFYAIYYPDGQPESRKCKLCGKVETKTEVWK